MSVTHLEKVFERGTEEINDHDVERPMLARPHNPWYARGSRKRFVYFGLLLEGTRLRHCGFKLDGDLLTGNSVYAEEYAAYKRNTRVSSSLGIAKHWKPPEIHTASSLGYDIFESVFPAEG